MDDAGGRDMRAKLSPVSPGEILLEEFLKPLGLSQNRLARELGIAAARVNDIVHARRSITADSAARLAVFFGTSPDFWLNLQARYDAKVARRELVPAVAKQITPHRVPAA
jgi:addiction module HigA family antidote